MSTNDCTNDAALALALADEGDEVAVAPVESRKRSLRLATAATPPPADVARASVSGSRGKAAVRTTKQPRSGSAAAELAAVTLFARHVERHPARLMLFLPEDHELVSASTYRVLAWGGGSHRETIRSYAPELHAHVQAVAAVGESIVHLDGQSLSANRAEWDQLPFVVPTIAPRDGHVYVTHESGEKLSAGGELYHRIYIEEQGNPSRRL